MAGKLKTKNPIPYIEVLPSEVTILSYDNEELIWSIEEINDTIIFNYDVHTKFISWDSVHTNGSGQYYKRVHSPQKLLKAIEEWTTTPDNWDDAFNKLPF